MLFGCTGDITKEELEELLPDGVHTDKAFTIYMADSHHLEDKKDLNENFCYGKRGECSGTIKLLTRSSDGFLFETFQSNSPQDVQYCDLGSNEPCSSQGDYGGGRLEMNVWMLDKGRLYSQAELEKKKLAELTKKQEPLTIKGGHIGRVNAPVGYPYLVMEIFSGGGSCCVRYEFFLKENIFLKPYIINFTKKDILYFVVGEGSSVHGPYRGIETVHPGSEDNPLIKTKYIDSVIFKHFENQ